MSRAARQERSAGGVVVRLDDGRPLFLLIRDGYGHWGFPKGHLERGERAATAALREVMEESGVRGLTVHGTIDTITWWFRLKGTLIHKQCEYFLMETSDPHTAPQQAEGITDCRWVAFDEGLQLLGFENARGVLRRAHEMMTRGAGAPER